MEQKKSCSFTAPEGRVDHLHAEEDLPKSQCLSQLMLESLPDAVIVTDANGHILQVNAEMERLFGYQRDELLGQPVELLIPRRYHERHLNLRRHYSEAPYRLKMNSRSDLYGRRKDGVELPVDIHLAPIESAQGRLVIGVVRDITPYKKFEDEIQNHIARKTTIAELGQLALAETALDRLMEHITAKVAQCLGVEYTKILELLPDGGSLLLKAGVGWKEGLVGQATVSTDLESQAGYTLLLSRPAEDSSLVAGEPVIVDDLRRETRFTGPPLLFEHGVVSGMSITIPGYERPYGVFGVHTTRRRQFTLDDIQFLRAIAHLLALAIDRRRAERALRASETRTRRLLEANVMGVLEGVGDQITDANPMFLEMLGYCREDLLAGRLRWKDLTPPEYRSLDAWAVEQLLNYGAVSPFEKEYIRRDGGRVPVLLGAALLERSPFTWICVAVDLSERKRLEDSLHQRAEELVEADRRKDEFLAMLAHELRNPLAPICNAVHLLHRKGGHSPEFQSPLNMIDRQARHLTRLVDDLLDVARVTRGKINLHRQRVDLAAIVVQSVETHRPSAASRRHTVTVDVPSRPCEVDGDPVRLTQMIDNLLSNAIKYTPDGGHIQVTVGAQQDEAVVSVRDDGIGIAEKELLGVFDLFAQANPGIDRARGGLGIGLPLVKKLVDLHDGHVEARSEALGLGSEFIIRLPLMRRETATPPGEDRAPSPVENPEGLEIVVVDDNHDVADSLAMLVKSWGCQVRTAYDAKAAIHLCQAYRPDVILLDIGLPGMDGYEIARRLLHDHGSSLVLVAMTGYGQAEDRRRTAAAGFHHHLVKPFDPDKLRTLLASLGSGQR